VTVKIEVKFKDGTLIDITTDDKDIGNILKDLLKNKSLEHALEEFLERLDDAPRLHNEVFERKEHKRKHIQ
jgi:hypothetical protein